MIKQIIDIVKKQGPIKAKDIAYQLNVDTSTVNSILYRREVKDFLERDNSYKWKYKENISTSDNQVNADYQLNKITKYFINCLSREKLKLSVFARSNYNLQYTQLSNFNTEDENFNFLDNLDNKEYSRLKSSISNSQRAYNQKGGPKQECIGYPIYMNKFKSKKGDYYYVLKPLFIISIDNESNLLTDIRLNADFFEHVIKSSNNASILEQMNDISTMIELHANSDNIEILNEMLQNIKSERLDWPWEEDFDIYKSDLKLSEIDYEDKIINCAIYTGMEQSKFTRGLESELQSLSKMSTDQIKGTALYDWIYNTENLNKTKKVNNFNTIQPVNLNDEQLLAVKNALTSNLSVISGPPGTGKSQVVSSLLINSIYNNTTVLFSSKNNQAVDVVIDRTNKESQTPVLLHLSKQKRYSKLKSYCENVINNAPNDSVKRKLQRSIKKLKNIDDDIKNIEELDASLRNKVLKINEKYKQILKDYDISNKEIDKKIQSINSDLNFKTNLKRLKALKNKIVKDYEEISTEYPKRRKKFISSGKYHTQKALKFLNENLPKKEHGFFKRFFKEITFDEEAFIKILKRLNNFNKINSIIPIRKYKFHKNHEKNYHLIKSLNKNIDFWQDFDYQNLSVHFLEKKEIENINEQAKNFQEIFNSVSDKKINIKLNQDNLLLTKQKILKKYNDINIYIDLVTYLDLLNSLDKNEDSFDLTKKIMSLKEQKIYTSKDIWEFFTKVRSSTFNKDIRKEIQEFLTILGLLEDSNISDGQQINDKRLAAQFNKHLNKVMKIAPCWSVTSLSAKSKIPFKANQFDLLVIDEASQNDIASVLPLLFRSKRAVIIGDEQQLKHISGISPKEDLNLLESFDLLEDESIWSYSQNSLFKIADSKCNQGKKTHLLDHFRSHKDIINFSNKYFYGGSLRVATSYNNLKLVENESVVRWINIKGQSRRPSNNRSLINIEESKAILSELNNLKDNNYEGSIGIVTPYRAQANQILKDINSNENLYNWFIDERNGSVNTVHLFQGDERDIMFFSTVVTKNVDANVMNFFKPNLFNVAITRARAALWIIGNKEDCMNFAHEELSNLTKYVNNLGERVVKKEEIPSFRTKKYPHNYVKELNVSYTEWEVLLYEELAKNGIYAVPQFQVDQYKLDLAVFDQKNDRKLNIECDGHEFHSDEKGELITKDRIRNLKMIEQGWDVKRFWNNQIRDNLQNCVSQIIDWKENYNEKVELFKGQQIL